MPTKRITSIDEYLSMQGTIEGWFYPEDAWLFRELNALQKLNRVSGDLLEIGVYHGKSAILLGYFIQANEQLVVCDLFERRPSTAANRAEVGLWYSDLTRDRFESNYLRFHTCLPRTLSCSSPNLIQAGNLSRTFRFIHIDGSHLYPIVRQDIFTARVLLREGGIVIFDDYRSEHTPGVAAAVWEEVILGRLIPLCLTPQKFYATWDQSHHRLRKQLAKRVQHEGRMEMVTEKVLGRTFMRVKQRPAP